MSRHARVVGTLPDGRSALMLVTARLEYVAESEWGSRRYLDVTRLDEQPRWRTGLGGCRKARKNLDSTNRDGTATAQTATSSVRAQKTGHGI